MSLTLGLVIFLVGPAFAEGPPPVSTTAAAPAAPAVASLLGDDALKDLDAGVSVRCTSDGASWGEHRAHTRMNPASGAKLLSTAAALHALGPEHTFVTRVLGRHEGDVARDVVLVAAGDPSLEGDDLDALAQALAARGVRRIDGGLVIDISHFAGESTPPAFDAKSTDAGYRPEVPAFAVDSGAFFATVSPARKLGDPVRVTTSLVAPSLLVDNSATTVAGKAIHELVIEARAAPGGRTRLVVSGKLGKDAKPQGVKKRLADPARVAADLFARALARHAIDLDGRAHLHPSGDPELDRAHARRLSAEVRAGLSVLAQVTSQPLAEDVARINTTSNNFMAEALFKQLGVAGSPTAPTGPATWDRAAERTSAALTALGLPPDGFEIINGSGLYDGTKVSAAAMTRLLQLEAADTAPARAFRESLAVAGRSGTLRARLKKLAGKVSGKTGTLDDALSLSGYVPAKRCALAFSVIVNGAIGKRAAAVNRAIDRFVAALAAL